MGLDAYLVGFKKRNPDGQWVEVECPSYMLGYLGRRTIYEYISENAVYNYAIPEKKDHGEESTVYVALRYDLLLRKKDTDLKPFEEYLLHSRLGLIMNVLDAIQDEFGLKAEDLCCVVEASF